MSQGQVPPTNINSSPDLMEQSDGDSTQNLTSAGNQEGPPSSPQTENLIPTQYHSIDSTTQQNEGQCDVANVSDTTVTVGSVDANVQTSTGSSMPSYIPLSASLSVDNSSSTSRIFLGRRYFDIEPSSGQAVHLINFPIVHEQGRRKDLNIFPNPHGTVPIGYSSESSSSDDEEDFGRIE